MQCYETNKNKIESFKGKGKLQTEGTKFTLKAPITTAADDIHKYFHCFSEKIRLGVSSESSARQRIHMKNQALFFSKDKSEKLKCRLLQFLFGAVCVNKLRRLIQNIDSKTHIIFSDC